MESREIKEYIKRRISEYEDIIERMQEMIMLGEGKEETIKEVDRMYLKDEECIEILRWITRKEGREDDADSK